MAFGSPFSTTIGSSVEMCGFLSMHRSFLFSLTLQLRSCYLFESGFCNDLPEPKGGIPNFPKDMSYKPQIALNISNFSNGSLLFLRSLAQRQQDPSKNAGTLRT